MSTVPGAGPPSQRARVLAVTSGKGGVGKTFVSANLAAALAARGKRVLVLDADLGLANLDVVLNLHPKVTLHDVFTGNVSLERALLPAPGNFTVMLAGSGLVEYSRLTPVVRDRLLEVLEAVRPRFDLVLLDTGAGISDLVLYTVSLADDVLIVVTPEPTSLTDAYAMIKLLAQQQDRRSFTVAVNQVGRIGDGRIVQQQLQAVVDRFVRTSRGDTVRLDFIGDVPFDNVVRDAVSRRELLFDRFPGSESARALAGLAARLG